MTVNFDANSKMRNWNCKIRVEQEKVGIPKHYDSRRSKKTRPKYQSTESGSLKIMHQHKILTYMSFEFVCLIEDEHLKCQNRKVKKVGHIKAQRMGRDESDPAT